MKPHYYLMKNKKILRLEHDQSLQEVSHEIISRLLEQNEPTPMNQDQANWRVVIFRDEILELQEYTEWLMEEKMELGNSSDNAH